MICKEIDKDIENKDYSSAYVKASTLVFDGGGDEKRKKWSDIQEEVKNKIEQAENGQSSRES